MTITREDQTGFELPSIVWECSGYWGGNMAITSDAPRSGTYAYRNGGDQNSHGSLYWNLSASYQKRMGLYFRTGATYSSVHCRILTLYNSAGTELLRISTTNGNASQYQVILASVGTIATLDIVQNTYCHWGLDVKINATTGWVYLYKDADLVCQYNGNTGSTQITRFALGSYPALNFNSWANGSYAYYDDLLLEDSAGEGAPGPVPLRSFLYYPVSGNGTQSNLDGSDGNKVDNYALLDENPPSGTDYVFTAASGTQDDYALPNITLPVNSSINAVIPLAIGQKGDYTDCKIALGLLLSGTEDIETGQAMVATYRRYIRRLTSKPGGGAWTESDFNNLNLILKTAGTFT